MNTCHSEPPRGQTPDPDVLCQVLEELRRRRAVLAAENAREIAAFKIQWWWIGLWKVRGSPVKRWAALQSSGESFSPDLKA